MFPCLPRRRTKDGSDRDGLHPEHLAKRPCTISPSQRFSPSTGLPPHPPPNGLPTHPPNGLPHPSNHQVAPQHYRLEDMALAHQYRDVYRHNEHRDVRERHRQTGRQIKSHGMGGKWSVRGTTNKGQLSVQWNNLCVVSLYKAHSRTCLWATTVAAIYASVMLSYKEGKRWIV